MIHAKKRYCLYVLSILLAQCLPPARADQNNSLYRRAERQYQSQNVRGKDNESGVVGNVYENAKETEKVNLTRGSNPGWTPVVKAHWFGVEEPKPKDYGVHDLITIIVNEVSKHMIKADTEAKREQSIDFTLQDWIRLTGGNLRPDLQSGGDPKISGTFDRDFKGESDVKREDTLVARIQASIVDVMPNGNLMLEARHSVIVDDETTTITLTGICRSKDVGIDNTVLSSKVADLKINKKHTGITRDATKRSFLHEFLDFVNPF